MDTHPQHSPKLLKVGQLAEQSGKTVRAIRFYEELGLLAPTLRTSGGFRKYDGTALIRIHWIDRLSELGFSLQETNEFLSSLQSNDFAPEAMEQLRSFYAKKLLETKVAITKLKALESELVDSIMFLTGCQDCLPNTPRTACSSCEDSIEIERPALVAAVQE